MLRSRLTFLNRVSGLSRLLVGLGGATCLLPASALALAFPGEAERSGAYASGCSARLIAPSAPAASADSSLTSKSAAILGGQPSALDLIRQQQAGVESIVPPLGPQLAASVASTNAFSACMVAFPPLENRLPDPLAAASPALDQFLGSARVGIRQTPFTDDWQRVSAVALSDGQVGDLPVSSADISADTLAQVNRWANRRIVFAADSALYGARDYWATAEETLAAGQGDCEDYAILKFQLLASLGLDRRDMYLTLARDLVRNADHAVLVVRLGDRHYLLDSATDVLLPAHVAYDYRPTLSFNSESAWLHGAIAAPRRLASL